MARDERTNKLLIGVVAVFIVVTVTMSYYVIALNNRLNAITGAAAAGNNAPPGGGVKEAQPLPNQGGQNNAGQPSRTLPGADDDPSIGSPDAPVTIIEFSDFQCPFCARFSLDTLPQLKENYISKGKVRMVFRDFPLGFHAQALPAAEAAECADEQGKFWEMHDKIFQNQGSLGTSSYKQWAKDLGLDSAKFDACLDSGKYANEVNKDLQDGQSAGVSGTPTFFINGKEVVGAQPFSVFQQVIDAELKK